LLGSFFAAGMVRLLLSAGRGKVPQFGAIFEGGAWFGKMLLVTLVVGLMEGAIVLVTFGPAGALAVRDLGPSILDANPEEWQQHPDRVVRLLERLTPEVALAAAVGFLFWAILTIVVMLRVKFAQYYVVDAGLGPMQGIGASWNATRGQVIKLFAYGMLEFLVVFAATLACCLPLLVALPLVRLGEGLIFLHISGRLESAAPPPA
jgi:hypothetical protein